MNEQTQHELDRIYRRDGILVPAIVVDEARPEQAPLHPQFTWDDGIAAEEWRREEARRLIRVHRIVIDEAAAKEPQTVQVNVTDGPSVPAYMNITHPVTGLRGYYATEDLLADERTKELLLQQVRRDIASLRRKYQGLVDFDSVLQSELNPAA